MLASTDIKKILFADQDLILDAAGALYWPAENTLLVSDLHLEKGSYFAKLFSSLPLYDTFHTLQCLQTLIEKYRPEKVVCLGDNLHDKSSLSRMQATDLTLLTQLTQSVATWIWIIGNHDKDKSAENLLPKIIFLENVTIQKILLTHEFDAENEYQIGGHFHPKIKIAVNKQRIEGKCFVVSENKIIMPAFGSYTGGMYVTDPVFSKTLANRNFQSYMLRENAIWRIL